MPSALCELVLHVIEQFPSAKCETLIPPLLIEKNLDLYGRQQYERHQCRGGFLWRGRAGDLLDLPKLFEANAGRELPALFSCLPYL